MRRLGTVDEQLPVAVDRGERGRRDRTSRPPRLRVSGANCGGEGPFEELVPFVPRYTYSQLGASHTGDRRNRKAEVVHLLTALRCPACGYVHLFAPEGAAVPS